MAELSVPGLGHFSDRERHTVTETLLILPERPDGEGLLVTRAGARADLRQAPIATLTEAIKGPYDLVLPGQQVRSFLTDVPDKVRGADRIMVDTLHSSFIRTEIQKRPAASCTP